MTPISDFSRSYEKVPVQIFEDQKDAAKVVVDDIIKSAAEKVNAKKNLILALSASSACIQVYEDLVKAYEAGKISFKKVEVFTIDEYYPLDKNELQSHYRFFKEYLFDLVDIPQENIHCIDSTKKEDINNYCQEFEKMIQAKGIDILITSNMGSNEPGSAYNSRTRQNTLNYTTRVAAASDFFGVDYVPCFLCSPILLACFSDSNAINLSPLVGVSFSPVISTGSLGNASVISMPKSFFKVLTFPNDVPT